MANGEALAMAELKRSREEQVVAGGSKRLKQQSELFDEPLEAVAPSKQNAVSLRQESRLGIREDEAGGGEVVHAADNNNNNNTHNKNDETGVEVVVEEEALYSDVEFVESEEESDEDEEYTDEDEYDEAPPPASDRKGKGIVIDNGKGKGVAVEDYKGKGKAIVEDDSSDDSDAGVENAEFLARVMEEEFMEEPDPLEEVDLNNILPTRTRRRQIQVAPLMHPEEAPEVDDEDDEDYVLGGGSSHAGN